MIDFHFVLIGHAFCLGFFFSPSLFLRIWLFYANAIDKLAFVNNKARPFFLSNDVCVECIRKTIQTQWLIVNGKTHHVHCIALEANFNRMKFHINDSLLSRWFSFLIGFNWNRGHLIASQFEFWNEYYWSKTAQLQLILAFA